FAFLPLSPSVYARWPRSGVRKPVQKCTSTSNACQLWPGRYGPAHQHPLMNVLRRLITGKIVPVCINFYKFIAMTETFKIFQVNSTEAEKIIASENEPHHHDFEELIIGTE